MKLIIVRHGESKANVEHKLQGQTNGELTKLGKKQAKKLGLRLKDEEIDIIFSSDLYRVKQTTIEIAKHHNVPIYYIKDFREWNVGVFEGRSKQELLDAAEENGQSIASFRPESGENFYDVAKRIKIFLEELYKNHKGKTILLCTHGDFIRIILSMLLNKDIEKATNIKQENAAINIIETNDNLKHKAFLMNSTDYLL